MHLSRYAEYETHEQRDKLLAYHVTRVCVLKLQHICTNCVTVHNFYLVPEVGPPCCLRIVCNSGNTLLALGGREKKNPNCFVLVTVLRNSSRRRKDVTIIFLDSQCITSDDCAVRRQDIRTIFLTFCGPCIVIYLRNKDQQDAFFSLNLFH
jgi:hypothetical protein